MTFNSLDEAYQACAVLAEERTTILSILKAYQYVVSALIATHPNHTQFQLHLASIEGAVDPEEMFGKMSERQRHIFDSTLQAFRNIDQVTVQIDPLAQMRNRT